MLISTSARLESGVRAIRGAFVHRLVPTGLPHGASVDELKASMLDTMEIVSAAVSTRGAEGDAATECAILRVD